MTEFIIIRFQANYNFFVQYFLINNGGFSQLTREFTMFSSLCFKEVRNKVFTIRKTIHFCLFKANCLHINVAQKSWILFFTFTILKKLCFA